MGIRNDCLFNEFVPRPKEEEENWHAWNNEHWGTKWDADFDNYLENIENDEDIDLLNLTFNTAWGPPIDFYRAMTKLGFEVSASYTEEEGEYEGGFENGEMYETKIIPSDDEEEDDEDEIVEITERLEHLVPI